MRTEPPFIDPETGLVTFTLTNGFVSQVMALRGGVTPEEIGSNFEFTSVADGLWQWSATATAPWGLSENPHIFCVDGVATVLTFGSAQPHNDREFDALVRYVTLTFGKDAHMHFDDTTWFRPPDARPETRRSCSVRRTWGYVGVQYHGLTNEPQLTVTWRR